MNSQKNSKKSDRAVGITDTTFRDGHQSTLATRFRTGDMLEVADRMNEVGFHSMEVWGGATFDVTTRYLNEDPWERLEKLKEKLPDTPLQMLLRGQNLVGYRNYADDVVELFIREAADAGIDIFRVFDALNDTRNFEASFDAIRKAGKEIQGTICYSITENRLGGEVFNLDYYREKASAIEEMGADSLCIKDMAGLLNPFDSYSLITALKETVSIPIQLHCHYTSGMASMSYLKAIEAGVDVIDCSLAPFALRSSQPSVEAILAALQETERDPGIEMEKLIEIGSYIEEIAPKYCCYLNDTKMSIIDTGVIKHQVPGGMLTNLVNQLREADALDRIDDVFEELPRTRKELGYPPLVTPTSQIVGIQSVQNVLFGRYKMISGQVKDYAYGLYGRPPIPIDRKVQKKALKDYPRGDKPIEHRPADILEPELDKARELAGGIARNDRDLLICALYPTTGLRFLRWKYGLEEIPDEVKPKSLEDVRKEKELIEKVKSGDYDPAPVRKTSSKNARSFNVFVGDERFNVEVEEVKERARFKAAGDTEPIIRKEPKKKKQKKEADKNSGGSGSEGEFTLTAPMPGMVIEYKVEEGDKVEVGDVLLILEAMKMQNSITSNVTGVIESIKIAPGNSVEKNQVIMVIAQ